MERFEIKITGIMKENILKKIYNHPEQSEIISKLTMDITAKEIHLWLSSKYAVVDKSLVIPIKHLQQFKDEYLDLYKAIRNDAIQLHQETTQNLSSDINTAIKNNSIYRQKLEEYLDDEIDIKKMVKNLVIAIEFRASQVFDEIQANPKNGKLDYILINYMNSLVNLLEKYDQIINGSPDKIIQQNNINIQILDQHIGVFHKVIREVISRLDYDTSLLFVDTLNEELRNLKPATDTVLPIDVRLNEAKKLEAQISNQLDVPSV